MVRLNKYGLLVKLIILYTFTTLSYTLWPISSPNRILGSLIFFVVVYIEITTVKKKDIISLVILTLLCAIAMLLAEDFSRNLTDTVYWIITVVLLKKISSSEFTSRMAIEVFRAKKWIRCIVIICNILLCVGFFDSRCYDTNRWVDSYFIGYTNAAHTLCAGVCLLMVLTLFMLRNKKKTPFNIIYFIPSIIAILESGARVYLIPVLIICYIFYVYYLDSVSLKIVLLPIVAAVAIYAFLHSGMIDKFNFVNGNEYISSNAAAQMTSGRTEFWIIDLIAYSQLNVINQLIGNGFDYVYYVNENIYGLKIWAHNDIINILLSTGLIGVILYVYVIITACKNIFKKVRGKLVDLLLTAYMLIPLMINGFFGYQHYLYSFLFISILSIDTFGKNIKGTDKFKYRRQI